MVRKIKSYLRDTIIHLQGWEHLYVKHIAELKEIYYEVNGKDLDKLVSSLNSLRWAIVPEPGVTFFYYARLKHIRHMAKTLKTEIKNDK